MACATLRYQTIKHSQNEEKNSSLKFYLLKFAGKATSS